MSNIVEWPMPATPTTTGYSMFIADPSGLATTIVRESDPLNITLTWNVPPAIASWIGGQFRLRVYGESIGPGSESSLGAAQFVSANGSTTYNHTFSVSPNPLLPEDASNSGVYKIVAVLQHLDVAGVPTGVCGNAEVDLMQVRHP